MKKAALKPRAALARAASLLLILSLALGGAAFAAPPAEEPVITADSAIVIDYDTGETLYAKDADSMRVPASMTKVMTAYIIMEELEAGTLTLDTQVSVSAENARRSRDAARYPASVPLPSGSKQTVDTMLKLILLPSASASCIVMAEHISGSEAAFVQRMNETAQRLGMTAAYENCHGAHPHELTARSQAILVREFIQRFPQILEYTAMNGMDFNGEFYPNTNKLLAGGDYAYEGADGFKTGTIKEAGYCLSATAVRDGRRIISVVMHADDDKTRHTDSRAVLDHGFQVLEERHPYQDAALHWSRDAVKELAALGAQLHPINGSFQPERDVTRAEFTAMLYTALEGKGALPAPAGEAESFTDVQGHWAEEIIHQAAAAGLVTGSGGGRFSPDATITRQEIMVIIDRFIPLPEENGLDFSDTEDLEVWALEAAARVTGAGLMVGSGGRLMPDAACSRAEAAEVIVRLLPLAAGE